jgi:LysM repeat protein
MDEEIESPPAGSMLPIALAVLAIALGGAGLYFGINASRQLTPLTDSVDAGTSSAARLEKQLSSIETRLTELGVSRDQLEKTVERLRIYGSQSERSVKQVVSATQSNRQEIVTLAQKMKELAAGVGSGSRPSNVGSNATSAAAGNNQGNGSGNIADRAELPGAGSSTGPGSQNSSTTYRIQPGDTFAKLATERGLSLSALLDANPEVDTRRLQIGQVIQLPNADE